MSRFTSGFEGMHTVKGVHSSSRRAHRNPIMKSEGVSKKTRSLVLTMAKQVRRQRTSDAGLLHVLDPGAHAGAVEVPCGSRVVCCHRRVRVGAIVACVWRCAGGVEPRPDAGASFNHAWLRHGSTHNRLCRTSRTCCDDEGAPCRVTGGVTPRLWRGSRGAATTSPSEGAARGSRAATARWGPHAVLPAECVLCGAVCMVAVVVVVLVGAVVLCTGSCVGTAFEVMAVRLALCCVVRGSHVNRP